MRRLADKLQIVRYQQNCGNLPNVHRDAHVVSTVLRLYLHMCGRDVIALPHVSAMLDNMSPTREALRQYAALETQFDDFDRVSSDDAR